MGVRVNKGPEPTQGTGTEVYAELTQAHKAEESKQDDRALSLQCSACDFIVEFYKELPLGHWQGVHASSILFLRTAFGSVKPLIKMIESYCEVIYVRRNTNPRASALGITSGSKYTLH